MVRSDYQEVLLKLQQLASDFDRLAVRTHDVPARDAYEDITHIMKRIKAGIKAHEED